MSNILVSGYLRWDGTKYVLDPSVEIVGPAGPPGPPGPSGAATVLAGDVTGPVGANTVVNINGTSVPAAPTANQVLVATGSTSAIWEQISNAQVSSTAALAVNKLASGTSAQVLLNNATPTPTWTTLSGDATVSATGSVTVTKIDGATVPAAGSLTIGNVLQVSGASALTYAPINLAGGANFVTGTLPVGNQASQTMGGDVSGTTASATVNTSGGLKTATTTVVVSGATAPTVGQVLTATNSTTATWQNPAAGGTTTSSGLFSARPAPGTAGNVYKCTDGNVPFEYVDNGSAWLQFYHDEYQPAPIISNYTTVGSLNLSACGDAISAVVWLADIAGGNTGNTVALVPQVLSPTATWYVRCDWIAAPQWKGGPHSGDSYPGAGVVVANGTTSGISTGYRSAAYYYSAFGVLAENFVLNTTTRSTYKAQDATLQGFNTSGIQRARLLCDGTDLHFQYSADGLIWSDTYALHSCPSGLTQYGFFVGSLTGGGFQTALILQNKYSATLTVPQATVTGATGNGVPVQLTVTAHPFRTGDFVSVVGMVGNTTANSTGLTVKVIDANTIALYNDTTTITGNGTWTSGGKVTCLSR